MYGTHQAEGEYQVDLTW